jgi:opacity protein-like surface antigen
VLCVPSSFRADGCFFAHHLPITPGVNLQRIAGFLLAVLLTAAPIAAQGFGIGGRMSMVRGDVQADPNATALRFLGGQLRARLSPKTAIEVSLERRTDNPTLVNRVHDYPLQGSLLLYPIRSTFSPYLLGGVGWYTHVVDTLSAGQVVSSDSSRKVGYHGGFGAELKVGAHAGIHADYRYTMIHFGDGTSTGTAGLVSRLKPSYDGSMWTAGFTFYF